MQSCFLEAVALPSIWLEHRLAPARPPSVRSVFGEWLGHVPLTQQRMQQKRWQNRDDYRESDYFIYSGFMIRLSNSINRCADPNRSHCIVPRSDW